MALIVRPPITGDNVLDSWTNQITLALNQGLLSGGTSGGGTGDAPVVPANFNTATIFLYQRTLTPAVPLSISVDTVFDYETNTLTDPDGNTGSVSLNDGIDGGLWFRELPASSELILNQYVWVTAVNIADTTATEDIDSTIWSAVALLSKVESNAPVPTQIVVSLFTQTSATNGTVTCVIPTADLNFGGYTVRLEQELAPVGSENWFTVATTVPNATMASFLVSNIDTIRDETRYRVIGINEDNIAGVPSLPIMFTPPVPGTMTSLTFVRDAATTGTLSWVYDEAGLQPFVRLKYFVIEFSEGGSAFSQFAVADPAENSVLVTGVDTDSLARIYRAYAVSVSDIEGPLSATLTTNPPEVEAPIGLVAIPIEFVGAATSVELTWTRPTVTVNTLVTANIQFRPVTEPVSAWVDIQTVSAEVTEIDNLPPQQGFVSYRIRYTAINGISSLFSEALSIFISGGAATDDAIFGADGQYISQPHYSVNSDDIVLGGAASSFAVTPGTGTYDQATNIITGINNEQLEIDWFIEVSDVHVERGRHFYLDLGVIGKGGDNPPNWAVANGTVFLEILTAAATTRVLYDPTTPGPIPDQDLFYTDSGISGFSTRSFDDRAAGNFMYASREFLRLPIRRTVTFREVGQLRLRLRFVASTDAHPIIDLNLVSPPTLQAFATEILSAISFTAAETIVDRGDGVGPSAEWVFGNNRDGLSLFEAPPMIIATCGGNSTAYFTNKTATSVRIHTTALAGCDVDVTARGR